MGSKTKLVTKLALSCSALLFLGFGCRGLNSTQVAATKPVVLEYWTVFDDVDAIQKQIDSFRVERPYITVNLKQLSAAEFYPRLLEALASDQGPDLISIRSRSLGTYQTKLAPMPPTITDTLVTVTKSTLGTNTNVTINNIPALTPNQIDSSYVQTVGKDAIRDGKIYGLPLSLDTMALYYNKDLLDRAGIPTPPKTWDEFQIDVKKLTRYDKINNKIIQAGAALGTGSNVPGVDDLLYILMKQSAVDLIDKSNHATFNFATVNGAPGSGPAPTVIDFYTDFANPARDTYTWNDTMPNALDAFINGQVAFFFGYSYHNAIIKARAPGINYGILPMLQLNPDKRVNVANYYLQSVVAKSKHPNEAWDLILWLTSSDATKQYLKDSNRPTALRALISEQLTNLDLAPFVQDDLVADSWYRGNNYDAAAKALQDMVKDWLNIPPNADHPDNYRQNIMDTAAQKINQTL